MFDRRTTAEFSAGAGDGNRRALQSLAKQGRVPGLLAYDGGIPVGWVSVGPRQDFGRLLRSPVLKPSDEVEAWSITCFYIHPRHRGRGVGTALLEGAVKYARQQGARIVEGYPIVPRKDEVPDMYAWRGLESMFLAAGFTEVARRKPGRPIVRKKLRPPRVTA